MALVLKSLLTEAKDSTFFDLANTTGLFNSITNTGGFNGSNVTIASVTAMTISVMEFGATAPTLFVFTVASGTITGLNKTDVNGVTTAISPFSPTTFDENFVFRVYASYFGLTTFTDGANVIRWTVNGIFTSTAYTYYVVSGGDSFFIAQARCCINSELAILAQKGGCKGCGKESELLQGDLYLKSAVASAECGKLLAAANALLMAQDICTGGCGGC